MAEPRFSEEERQAIADACRDAERRTSGEIVPYVVGACDAYRAAIWKGAALAGVASSVSAGIVHAAGGVWGGGVLWMTLPTLAGAALGYLAASTSAWLRRWLTPADLLELRARRRAAVAFLEEELFLTRERTGILILVALFEHRVVVLGDSGIHRRVAEEAWQGIVDHLVASIRADRLAQGLVEAIGECGELLETHGVAIRSDDTDELSNRLRYRES